MKNLFKPLLVLAILAVTFTSCMKNDNTDYDAENLRREQQLDSLLSAQATLIEAYVKSNYTKAEQDTVSQALTYLNKKVKRGFWFEIDSSATDNSYTYGFDNNGALRFPKVKVKYKAFLLSGGEPVRSDIVGSDYLLNISSSNASIVNYVWQMSFFPYSIRFNGNDRVLQGLTKNGLKKGNKFKVVTPSIYAFGATSVDKIPANSPIAYEFEVLGIE
jgi:FKBP-type peptidyl-prolyl cis-trans isomerase FkpA